MAVGTERKSAIFPGIALMARSAARSLLLIAIIAGLWQLVRQHSRALPTLLEPRTVMMEDAPHADERPPLPTASTVRAQEANGRFAKAERMASGTLGLSRPRTPLRQVVTNMPPFKPSPSFVDVPKKEAPVSCPHTLSKGEPQRLEETAPVAFVQEIDGKTSVADFETERATSLMPAKAAEETRLSAKKTVEVDWEKEEISHPIENAYAVVYLSRRFLGLCIEGKYIRRYRHIGINLPAGTLPAQLLGHWRVAERDTEEVPGQLRLVGAAADGRREILILAQGQEADLPSLLLDAGQVEEISRALAANAWVVIQP